MQTITIGRAGNDSTTGDVTSVAENGPLLAISGRTRYGSLKEALTIRAQLLGYVSSPDESFVPVTWAEFPHLDGYYRVDSARVEMPVSTALSGIFRWSVSLIPVTGFAAPLIESVFLGKLRASPFALTARRTVVIPGSARSYVEYQAGVGFVARAVSSARTGATSSVNIFLPTTDSFIGQFYLPPAAFYDGSATLRSGYPGRVLVGRQIQNEPLAWEMSNDLMQVRQVVSEAFVLEFRMWDVSAWSPWETLSLASAANGPDFALSAPHTITVLANSPEAVTIRLLTTSSIETNSSYSPVMVDLTLRRGARSVAVEWNMPQAFFPRAGASNWVDPVALTGGFTKLTNGRQLFMGSPLGSSRATSGTGQLYSVTTTKTFPFCFGLTNSTETPQAMLNEYFWAASEKMTVVAR